MIAPLRTRLVELRADPAEIDRILAAGAVLFVVALLVSPGFPQMRGRWSSALWNLLHVPAFFAITWGGATILPASLERVRRILYTVAGAFALGTLTEIVQGLTAGDEVVTAGQLKIRDGSAVTVAAARGNGVAAGTAAKGEPAPEKPVAPAPQSKS